MGLSSGHRWELWEATVEAQLRSMTCTPIPQRPPDPPEGPQARLVKLFGAALECGERMSEEEVLFYPVGN